eukprot:3012550-Amphidinium_carterae.2
MAQAEPESELDPSPVLVDAGAAGSHNSSIQCSLPFIWRRQPSSLRLYGSELKAYVVWRSDEHPLGTHHYSGVHIGVDPWPELADSGVFPGGYTPGRDRCRRVPFADDRQDWVAAGVALYQTEAARHHAPRQPCVWLWSCSTSRERQRGA